MSRLTVRVSAVIGAALLLLAPALWNRFPLLQYDTGGYLARWYEGYLVPSRAVAYGLFLNAATPLNFWPAVVVQTALTIWVVLLVVRLHDGERTPARIALIFAVLAITTSLPFLASILLTDIFFGLAVLAVHLLFYRADALTAWQRGGLFALIAFAVATHSATFAVLLALTIVGIGISLYAPKILPRAALARVGAALVAGALLTLTANYSVSGRFAWTPGGLSLAFARMLQDGIVTRHLNDHCPRAGYKLCPHRAELPTNADEFLWSNETFDQLGRFAGLGAEMEKIVLRSLVEYPFEQIKTAALATATQVAMVGSGHGIHDGLPHTQGIIERYMPSAAPAMKSARQQRGEFGFDAINWVHIPAGLISIALVMSLIARALWQGKFDRHALMAATVAQAVLANAFVCGAISGPHDRYGARIAWIATLAGVLALARAWDEARALRPRLADA